MKLNQLRDVVAISERGSLRSAARSLGVTQPAITRSIRELERELGAPLFERRPTGMALTAIGNAFVRRAISIQNELVRVRSEVEQMKGNRTGTVSIGLSTASHVALLSRVIGPFERRYGGVRLNVYEGLFPTMERDLQNGVIDLYVGPLGSGESPSDMLVEPLFRNRRLIFGRNDHPLAAATSLADLSGARWVTDALTLVSESEVAHLFASHGLPVPEIAVRSHTSLSTIITAANSELLAILPQQWLPILRDNNLLTPIPIRETLEAPTICMIKRAGLPLTPIAEHLEDLFRRAAINHAQALPGNAVIAA